MAGIACLVLLLTWRIVGQATPTSALATAQVAHSSGIDRNAEPGYLLVKRTSSRPPSPLRWSLRRQRTVRQPVPPSPIHSAASHAPHILAGADRRLLPDMSTATPSQAPAVGHSAPHTEARSSTAVYYKVKRRPHGSLKNNPVLKAQAAREYKERTMQRINDGVLIDKTRPDGSKYFVTMFDNSQAYNREITRRYRSKQTDEQKAKQNQKRRERRRRVRAEENAQLEGGSKLGYPLQKPSWTEQEVGQAGEEEVRRHVVSPLAMEGRGSTQHASHNVQGPGMLRLRTSESSLGSSPLYASPASTYHHFLPPSSSRLDLDLSLSAPGSSNSNSGQRHTAHAPQQAEPPAARTSKDEELQLALAPPRRT